MTSDGKSVSGTNDDGVNVCAINTATNTQANEFLWFHSSEWQRIRYLQILAHWRTGALGAGSR